MLLEIWSLGELTGSHEGVELLKLGAFADLDIVDLQDTKQQLHHHGQ